MVHVVAEVRDPYAPGNDPRRPPLSSGMFVEAEITGSTVNDVVVLPWAALRGRDQVLIVDETNRLRFRDVEILRSTSDEVLIRAGLAEGELVCISPLDTVTDGMVVRVVDDDLQLAGSVPAPADTPAAADPPGAVEPSDAELADAPPAAPETDPEPALQPSNVDATQSRDDQINAIRQELARLTGGTVSSATEDKSTSGVEPERRSATAAAGRPGRRGGRGREDAARGVADGNNRAGGRRERGRPIATDPPAPAPVAALDPVATTMALTGPRVALLPFLNLSRDPADADLGGTLTTALHAALMDGGTAGVVPLTTTDSGDALEDAVARNARWLVGGGYQRIGNQLRITARVRDVPGGAVIASLKEDGSLADLDMLTSKMIAAVRASLVTDTPDTPGAAGPIAATPAARTDAAPDAPRRRARAVAIGPFANISRNPDDDGLGENMVEALAGWLGQLQNVSVVSLDAVSDAAAMDAATEQNATWLIGGGYQRVGDQVRITARLIDVASGALIHTVKTDGRMDDLPALLAEVVSAVQAALAANNSQALRPTTLDEVAA